MTDPQKTEVVSSTLKEKMAERLTGTIVHVRDRRRPEELVWLNNHAAWKATANGRQMYNSPTFRHYIPVVRRAIERFVVRCTQTLIPSPDFFEVYPGNEMDAMAGKAAEAVRVYMGHLLTDRIKIRRLCTQLVRSLLLYNRAVTKTSVQVVDKVPFQWAKWSGSISEVWPTARVVDPFSFYVWPEVVSELEDAQLVFEDVMIPYSQYAEWSTQGLCDPINREDLGTPEWPYHWRTRLGILGFTDPNSIPNQGALIEEEISPKVTTPKAAEQFVALTEAWSIQGSRLIMVWIVWNAAGGNKIVRVIDRGYPALPYLMALARPIPGEHYTNSMMDDLEPLQILFNDQVNQSEEARAIATTPPVVIDVAGVGRSDQLEFGPRKKWLVDPNGVKLLEIPDTSMSGIRAQNITLSQINSLGGAGSMTEGAPTRGLPRGSGAVSQLISLSMGDIKDVAEILEGEILTPLMKHLFRLTLAFTPSQQVMQIPGSQDFPPATLDAGTLMGGWTFRWVGSLQAQDQQMRAQRMVGALGMLAKLQPALMQAGKTLNWGYLLKRSWRDAMGERGAEEIVLDMPPPPPPQPGMPPGMPPGALPPSGGGGGQAPPLPSGPGDMEKLMGQASGAAAHG